MDQNPFAINTSTKDSNPFAIDQSSSQADTQLGNQDFNGECQRFAEQVKTGRTGIYPTAISAWQDQAQKGNASPDVENAQSGDLIYFAPDQSNENAGHVGVSDGKGGMTSATYAGVQHSNVSDWIKSTGQQPLGRIQQYK